MVDFSAIGSNLLDLPRLDASIIQSILGGDASGITNGGIEYDDSGVPLMFRDSHSASNILGSSNLWYFNVPRYKFLYFIKFIPNSSVLDNTAFDAQSYLVNSLTKPSVLLETNTLNQYNKKRIIYQGRRYQPIDFSAWDTANNAFYDFFHAYMNYYFGDTNNTDANAWIKDTTSKTFNSGKNGWGYVIPTNSTLTNDSFLEKIQIFEFYGGDYRVTEVINPKITEIKFDTLDYSNGRDLSKFSARIDYEGINFLEEGIELLSDTDLMEEMQLDNASFYEPKRLITTKSQLNFVPTVSFKHKSIDTDYSTQASQSGLAAAREEQRSLSNISGYEGIFGNSGLDILGDAVSNNSGTLLQMGIGSGITNSITRGLSIVKGGIF